MEVVAVNVGGWKHVKRVELEHNGISDEEFVEAWKQARRESVFGEPKLWLDRRVLKAKLEFIERIRQKRRALTSALSQREKVSLTPALSQREKVSLTPALSQWEKVSLTRKEGER